MLEILSALLILCATPQYSVKILVYNWWKHSFRYYWYSTYV